MIHPPINHRHPRKTALRIFLTCWLIYCAHFATNTVRELYPALSLGDRLSFDVSEYAGLHPDIFELPGRGTFINNNPGASILAALPYALARPLIDPIVDRVNRARRENPNLAPPAYDSPWPMAQEFFRKSYERGFDVKFGLAAAVIHIALMAPLSAISALVMFYVLRHRTTSRTAAMLLALLFAFATPVFYRTAQLNQNLLVCHGAFFAFVLLWRPWDDPQSPRRPHYFLGGLLSGWCVVCDYSGVVVVCAITLYAALRRRTLPASARSPGDALRYIFGLAIAAAVLLGYQWSSFGHPLYPAQHYMPPAKYTDQGYSGFSWPQADLLFATLFDLRFGLFLSAPILLAALYFPGWFASNRLIGRTERCFIAVFSILFLLFCSANQYGRMQFNTGIRHVVPLTPFLFLITAGVLLRLRPALAVGLGVACTLWSWCLAMYRDVETPWGVLESLRQVLTTGPRLPCLTTLERMKSALPLTLSPRLLTVPFLVLLALAVAAIWRIGRNRATHEPS